MDLTHLIAHPEELDQETLYDLRRLVALHPTYHAARILFLQNLFLLHDPTFDQELRRAALLVPDRRVLFALTQHIAQRTRTASVIVKQEKTEAATVAATAPEATPESTTTRGRKPVKKYATGDTTAQLLDEFLEGTVRPLQRKKVKADPTTDYMSYLMQQEEEVVAPEAQQPEEDASTRLDSLIDSFIASQEEGIKLPENPSMPDNIIEEDELPEESEQPASRGSGEPSDSIEPRDSRKSRKPSNSSEPRDEEAVSEAGSGELSETLAQIYIKQQKYDRAIEILGKIEASESASSNPYLQDQMRYLQKLAELKGRGKKK